MIRPFHLAFPVREIEETRRFYRDVIGCIEGRSAETWVDFDFYGHQISCHLSQDTGDVLFNPVDGDNVPVPHFGVILEWSDWEALAERLESAGVAFIIPPRVRFKGLPGEQGTLFFRDPSGNALEFKCFRSDQSIFER